MNEQYLSQNNRMQAQERIKLEAMFGINLLRDAVAMESNPKQLESRLRNHHQRPSE